MFNIAEDGLPPGPWVHPMLKFHWICLLGWVRLEGSKGMLRNREAAPNSCEPESWYASRMITKVLYYLLE